MYFLLAQMQCDSEFNIPLISRYVTHFPLRMRCLNNIEPWNESPGSR